MRKLLGGIGGAIAALAILASAVYASHSWGGYHWARTANPFNLKLGDNLTTTDWKSYLGVSSSDWTQSTVLNTTIVPGQAKGNCRATSGRVEVCNKAYGFNGWLGIAQIWVSGVHITQGTTKMNDTYFNTPTYNSAAWRQFVICQEVGHTFGLDHQDTNFDNPNLGTCMDYTSNPDGPPSNLHPNAGDYDELSCIYDPTKNGVTLTSGPHTCVGSGHLDSFTTVGQTKGQIASQAAPGNLDNPSEWGRKVKGQGRTAIYERDFGGGNKVFTFVIFAE